jgi:hypothetical protein
MPAKRNPAARMAPSCHFVDSFCFSSHFSIQDSPELLVILRLLTLSSNSWEILSNENVKETKLVLYKQFYRMFFNSLFEVLKLYSQ